ncbi:DUF3679 domain-containing protein [Paenibacillus barcinonensis]|uniref:DUF3679 domain-containing protein n=1 Tax=Paenibacillus barcinonensis TaxID=198119 RepID=A0A2V4VMU3_PAEBA|nr:DUF3679 domain-containing protein [Paenibacillus barcinonensis]PYE47481.1 uncharacterized protein DUF3679 [Paenibacillus barcinonensis]QKS56395.1 DUF3679 domain-containing protein [Paenibacillus barcinonensis]
MSRFGKRMLSVGVLMLLGVLLGMQLAGNGFQQHKPAESVPAMATSEPAPAEPAPSEVKKQPFVPVQTPSQVLGADQHKAPVDVLADKTAGLLQNLSNSGIKWVVSLFGGVDE